jgi:hypothetical protein
MKINFRLFAIIAMITLLPSTFLLSQDTKLLIISDSLPLIHYTDQFDKEAPILPDTEKILFISDMDASKITHSVFEKEGNVYLEQNKTALISDIHRMPSLISRFVALPKMRDYPYTIRLIREAKLGDPFPRIKGQITCIELKSDKIVKIEYAQNEQSLRNFIEASSALKNKK